MEEQASGRQAHHRTEAEVPQMRQHILLLEQQQVQAMDVSQRPRYECQLYDSCGMQRALENRLLEEQNIQARALVRQPVAI
eukprot:12884002-Prorocentrum_lima.AAC.1